MRNVDTNEIYVVPFEAIGKESLPTVGGKGANLGVLTKAGFPVPSGFCITTDAYYRVVEQAGIEALLENLSKIRYDDLEALNAIAFSIRERLSAATIPKQIIDTVQEAYKALGNANVPVAVRSSATAEDLLEASFAGQQDTYLNIIGAKAVMEAVHHCWESLWNDRAVVYRARNGIDHRQVGISVVVQKLVEAKVAGVLFTANPLTGKRRQAVIDASPGLGEAVVSGATTPDQFIVNSTSGEIVKRNISSKRIIITAAIGGGTQFKEQMNTNNQACLSDEQVKTLASLGSRVEKYYGAPQDIEWALDGNDQIWLLQSRPITTLFPLPENAPEEDNNLHVYMSATGDEGVTRPLTPMGLQAYRIMISCVSLRLWKHRPKDMLKGPASCVEAGYRFYYDITSIVRSTIGQRLMDSFMSSFDNYTAEIMRNIKGDSRFAPKRIPFRKLMWIVLTPFIRTPLIPYTLGALRDPDKARNKIERLFRRVMETANIQGVASEKQRFQAIIRLLMEGGSSLFITGFPEAVAGYIALEIAKRLLGSLATEDVMQAVLRGLPDNPTTEMGLALWDIALTVKSDISSLKALTDMPSEKLTEAFLAKELPDVLQKKMTDFLKVYGNRAVAEIDMGLPRWSEDQSHLFGILSNYIKLEDLTKAPDVQFKNAVSEGEAVMENLVSRASDKSKLHGILVRWALNRARRMIGRRELWKTQLTAIFAKTRELLLSIGEDLVKRELLLHREDIFFVNLTEVQEAISGRDLHSIVRERKEAYEHELKRVRVPMILLSDGTEPLPKPSMQEGAASNALQGVPASPGIIKGRARILLDPTNAKIEPGEILVAPNTDPGWTPLFLTASGLVMERGGAISHGAVVAREYGIPAVVGVTGIIDRIKTGQTITVDGFNGVVIIEEEF